MEVGRLRLMLFIIPFLAAAMFQVNAALEWYRFIGGSGVEGVRGIALDSAGKVYVIGGNSSDDFPTSSGAYERSLKGCSPDGRVTQAIASCCSISARDALWLRRAELSF